MSTSTFDKFPTGHWEAWLTLQALAGSVPLLKGPFLLEGYAATRWQWYHSKCKIQGSAPEKRAEVKSSDCISLTWGLWTTVSWAEDFTSVCEDIFQLDSLSTAASFTWMVSFCPQIILHRQMPFLPEERTLRLRKVEYFSGVRQLRSDRARFLGYWASSYLSFTLSIPSRDLSGIAEGWLNALEFRFIHIFKF